MFDVVGSSWLRHFAADVGGWKPPPLCRRCDFVPCRCGVRRLRGPATAELRGHPRRRSGLDRPFVPRERRTTKRPTSTGLLPRACGFTNGYAACAVCSPTRAAMMTGRYPGRIGVTDWMRTKFQQGKEMEDLKGRPEYEGGPRHRVLCPTNPFWMDREEITLAEALGPAGYTSCHIGKWHLGVEGYYPEQQGFAFNYGGCDLGQPPSYFDPYENRRYDLPTLAPRKQGEYLTDREADEAVGFLRAHRDQPFFLYLAHYAVHTPIQAKKSVTAKYDAKPKTNHKNATYAAMIESVDDATGRVLETLDSVGLSDRTVVIFTSDNGGLSSFPRMDGPTDNTPLRWGKGHAYEGGIRVPWIIRWPGVTQSGTTCDEPICTIDVFPTLLAAAGIAPLPDRPIDGVDLRPILDGDGALDRDALYWHFPHFGGDQRRPYSIIRQGDWKLIRRYDTDTRELYNLANDLREKHDLASAMPEKVDELDRALSDHLRSVGAKLPKPNPDYLPP